MSDTDDDASIPAPWRTRVLFGHRTAERLLLDAYRGEQLHHAWLFGGAEGIGKATLAWRFARFLLANPDPRATLVQTAETLDVPSDHPAALRIAAGSHGDVAVLRREQNDKTKKLFSEVRVDDVRRALGLFQNAAGSGGYRICIVDSVEDLNRSSANALLKVVEEPPPRSLFMLLAHRPGQVMPTLVSRCRRLLLAPLADDDVAGALDALPGVRSMTGLETADIARRSHGSMVQALRLLDTDARDRDGAVRALVRRLPTVDWRAVHRLADQIGFSDDRFAEVQAVLFDELADWLRRGAAEGRSVRALTGIADAWGTIRQSVREAEALNLDKRPVLLGIVRDLAQGCGRGLTGARMCRQTRGARPL